MHVGLLIVCKKNVKIVVHNVIRDVNGRYIILYATFQDVKWVLASDYALNVDQPTFFPNFFKELHHFSPDNIVIGGDFNLGLEVQINRCGSMYNNNQSAKWLNTHLQNEDIVDTYGLIHPAN